MPSTRLSVRRIAWTHCYGLLRQALGGREGGRFIYTIAGQLAPPSHGDSVRISSRAQRCNLLSLHAATYEPGMSRLAAGSQAHPRREITPILRSDLLSIPSILRSDLLSSILCPSLKVALTVPFFLIVGGLYTVPHAVRGVKKGANRDGGSGERVAWGLPRGVLACPRLPGAAVALTQIVVCQVLEGTGDRWKV